MAGNKTRCNDFSCYGPNATHIVLVSSDNHEFIIPRAFLMDSPTIKNMMMGPGKFSSKEANKVYLQDYPPHILQKLCHYFMYRARYQNQDEVYPEFEVKPEHVFQLLVAADFLKC